MQLLTFTCGVVAFPHQLLRIRVLLGVYSLL